MGEIVGVDFKELVTHPDQRGFFRELIRNTDPFFADGFGQWSHSKMAENTLKAWHFHHQQTDWWYVPIGVIETVLYDNRPESASYKRKLHFKLGEQEVEKEAQSIVVKIPPGVVHGCKVLTPFAHLFYITSHTYNPNDEGRIPYNSLEIPHNWGNDANFIIAENDKKTFVPSQGRS